MGNSVCTRDTERLSEAPGGGWAQGQQGTLSKGPPPCQGSRGSKSDSAARGCQAWAQVLPGAATGPTLPQ